MTNLININLENLNSVELKNLAKELKVKNWWNLKKADLIAELGNLKTTQEETNKKMADSSKGAVKELNSKKVKTAKKRSTDLEGNTTAINCNPDNLITVKDLAAEFKMKAAKARRILRNNTVGRTFGGNRWEWDKTNPEHLEDLEMARTALKKYTK